MDSDRGDIRKWKSLFLPNELTRGMFAFLIEHTEGHLPCPKKFPDSSVNKLDHVVINTNDPEGFEITPVKEGRKPNTLVATVKSDLYNIPTLLIQHLPS